jgi:hypothetical protein
MGRSALSAPATAWGQMEWKGAFGARSVEWTASLRKQLDHTDTNDGTFWMSWHDVLSRFSGLDICKTHEVRAFAQQSRAASLTIHFHSGLLLPPDVFPTLCRVS